MGEVTLSHNRINKIQTAATSFAQGKCSLKQAQKLAKSQNIFVAARSSYIHLNEPTYKSQKQLLIENTFQCHLHSRQIDNVKTTSAKLSENILEPGADQPMPNAKLHQIFADLHSESDHAKISIEEVKYDKNQKLTILLNVKNKQETQNCNNHSVTPHDNAQNLIQQNIDKLPKEIEINGINPEQANLIMVEYAIFKHMQFGEPIENNSYIKGLGIIRRTDKDKKSLKPKYNDTHTKQVAEKDDTKYFTNNQAHNHNNVDNALLNAPLLNKLNKYYSMHKKFIYDRVNFAGGGAKGTSYVGILTVLGDFRLRLITAVSGASAGAITASLVGCGIKVTEFRDFVLTTNLKITQKQLIDTLNTKIHETVKKRLNEFEGTPNQTRTEKQQELITKYKNNSEHKLTFADLHDLKEHFRDLGFKDILINATLANSIKTVEVNLSYETSPNLEIAEAAAASAALPIFFKPIEVSGKIDKNYLDKTLGLSKKNKLFLRDGGLVTNIPNSYLLDSEIQKETGHIPNILNLGFEDNKNLPDRKDLSISHKIKDILVWMPCYVFRRFDIKAMHDYNQQIHYIDTKIDKEEIATTDFNKAMKKLILLCDQTNKSFRKWEFDQLKETAAKLPKKLTQQDLERLNKLKFEIHPDFFYGDRLTKRVLNSIPQNKTESFFELLDQTTDTKKFDQIYESYKQALREAKRERLKEMVNGGMWRTV